MSSKNISKKMGIGFIILMLFFPLIQEQFKLFEIKPLEGFFEQTPDPDFSTISWFDGSYQSNKEKNINQNFGLRNFLIRLNNQLDFWLFDKIHSEKVVLGKDGMLYEDYYIISYLGENYLGENKINEITNKLIRLQQYLEQKNKTLLIVLAPGKATFFPDQFPKKFDREKKRNNYEEFAAQMQSKGINTIDFNSWFKSKKGKTPFPLYTELGIHWTLYGSSLAFDSISKWVEKKRNIDIPDYFIENYECPNDLRSPDDDIYRAINLLSKMKHQKAAYPVFKTHTDSSKTQPTLLTIGDSYWWNIYKSSVYETVFNKGRFWYYNKEAFPESFTKQTFVETLDFKKVIEETDVITLCFTESTLITIGNGFIEKAYDTFCKTVLTEEEKKISIKNMMNFIRSDKKWMEGIKSRSLKEKLPVDSIIFYDARWQVEHN
jgi:hypothetical protein